MPTMQERIQNAKDKTSAEGIRKCFQQLPDSIKQQLFQRRNSVIKSRGKKDR